MSTTEFVFCSLSSSLMYFPFVSCPVIMYVQYLPFYPFHWERKVLCYPPLPLRPILQQLTVSCIESWSIHIFENHAYWKSIFIIDKKLASSSKVLESCSEDAWKLVLCNKWKFNLIIKWQRAISFSWAASPQLLTSEGWIIINSTGNLSMNLPITDIGSIYLSTKIFSKHNF